jgi:hypothetical protein
MNPQIVKALQLANKLSLKEGDLKGPTYRYISDIDMKLNYDIKDANFEIKYMMACGQLGFTDPEVTQYVRKRLAGK